MNYNFPNSEWTNQDLLMEKYPLNWRIHSIWMNQVENHVVSTIFREQK